MPSRRAVLTAGLATAAGLVTGGVGAVHLGLLPAGPQLARALGRCAGGAAPAGGPGAAVGLAEFGSAHRNRTVGWALALPPGRSAAGLPVVLVLHGRGAAATSAFDQLGLHHTVAEHTAHGGAPFALVAVDGGETYWHPRADGDDPLGMLVHELLPRLRDAGLRVDRIGVWGWSMGGYGALLLARESARDTLGGTRVVAAAAASPALFASAAETAPGAFDGPADFAAWGDLVARPEVARTTALRVSCGDADPFAGATRRYRAAVDPTPTGGIGSGCHDPGYWISEAALALPFLAAHL